MKKGTTIGLGAVIAAMIIAATSYAHSPLDGYGKGYEKIGVHKIKCDPITDRCE